MKFTIFHGFAISLMVHSAVALPFAAHLLIPLPDEPEQLTVELQGLVTDMQTEQQVLQETKDVLRETAKVAKQGKTAPPPETVQQQQSKETPDNQEPLSSADAEPVSSPTPPVEAKPEQAQAQPLPQSTPVAITKSGNPGSANNVTVG